MLRLQPQLKSSGAGPFADAPVHQLDELALAKSTSGNED
jgi:hypothetical protein